MNVSKEGNKKRLKFFFILGIINIILAISGFFYNFSQDGYLAKIFYGAIFITGILQLLSSRAPTVEDVKEDLGRRS